MFSQSVPVLPKPPEPQEDHIAEAGKMMRAAVVGVWERVKEVLSR